MITLLLTLFVVALIITFAGLLLSPKHHQDVPDARRVAYGARGGSGRQGSGNTRTMRRSTIEYERKDFMGNVAASLNVKSLFEPGARKQTPWLGILLILMALFGMGLFSMRTLLPNSGLMIASSWIDQQAVAQAPQTPVATANPYAQLMANVSGASKSLTRVGQLDPNQYASTDEFNTWAYSACSSASMTEVINAYGHNYRVTDILKVEAGLGEISPDQGLLESVGLDRTLAKFDFKTISLQGKSLDEIINVGNQGHPVIIDFPPERWNGGHILVLRGGDANNVFLADSSKLNMTVMARSKFTQYWNGFAVVGTPQNG